MHYFSPGPIYRELGAISDASNDISQSKVLFMVANTKESLIQKGSILLLTCLAITNVGFSHVLCCRLGGTHSSNRDEDLNKQASQGMLYVLILHLQEILGTLLRNTQSHTNMDEDKQCDRSTNPLDT